MSDWKLLIAHGAATYDATRLVPSVTWAGSYAQVARTLGFELLSPRYDKRQPSLPVAIGDTVSFYVASDLVFFGRIFQLVRDNGSETVSVTCFDMGLHLKRTEAAYRFAGQTPEAIAQRVCQDYGISVGELARTGISIRRNFPGVSLYKVIQTAYTLAAEQTGERYMIRFRGPYMDVIRKERKTATVALEPGTNLLSATISEDAQNAVSQVRAYDEAGNIHRTWRNEELIEQVWVLQAYLEAAQDKDLDGEADKLLEDNGIARTITVDTFGDHRLIAGESVIAREPVTGLTGLYWVDSDRHTWQGGVYRNKMTLNLRNLMDSVTAGKEPT